MEAADDGLDGQALKAVGHCRDHVEDAVVGAPREDHQLPGVSDRHDDLVVELISDELPVTPEEQPPIPPGRQKCARDIGKYEHVRKHLGDRAMKDEAIAEILKEALVQADVLLDTEQTQIAVASGARAEVNLRSRVQRQEPAQAASMIEVMVGKEDCLDGGQVDG